VKWLKKGWDKIFTWTPVTGGGMTPGDTWNTINLSYRVNSIAGACIRMIATSAPEAPLKVYRQGEDGKLEEVPDHWFNKLVRHPNDFISAYELWEQTLIYLLGGGSVYWLLRRTNERAEEGPIDEIRLLRPDRVNPRLDNDGNLMGWEYQPEDKSGVIFYPAYQVMAIQFPDPLNPYKGLSPAAQVLRELGVDNAATDFVKQFFDNGAVVAGILTTDQTLEPEEADAMEERWYQKFGRRLGGLFKTVVLGKGATYQQMALNFKDMEFEAVRSMVETRICGAFGVDPLLLPTWVGLKHNNTKASYQEARRHLWEETIVPILRRIEAKINSQILVYEEGYEAHFDLSQVEALQENTSEKWTRVLSAWEKNAMKLGDVQRTLGIPVDPEREAEYFSAVTASERNEGEENTPAGDEPEDDAPKMGEKAFRFKARDNIDPEKLTEKVKAVQDAEEEKIREAMSRFFVQLKKKVVSATYRKEISQTDLLLFRLAIAEALEEAERELGQHALILFRAAVLAGGQMASEMFGIDFNPEDTQLARAIQQYADDFRRVVIGSIRQDLHELMLQAERENWTVTKVRDEIRHRFNEYSETRAERIARTESVRMTNLGTATSYIQAGFTRFEWFTVHDKKTCHFCKKLDGRKVDIGVPFFRNGEVYETTDDEGKPIRMKIILGNILHPPLHPNCRCTILPD
jgi:HK97 family phage portal protein